MPRANSTQVTVDGRELSLTNLDKVLYPESSTTKAEVVDYYAKVAPWMLPYLAGRPVTLTRWPDGVDGQGFFEKQCPKHRPPWVRTVPVVTSKTVQHCLIEEPAALVWTANLAALELHAPLGRVPDLGRPTGVVFDLDPGPPAGLAECVELALELRDLFERAGMRCVVKTSGSKGLHVGIPLNTATTFDATKDFAAAVAALVTSRHPGRVVDVTAKEQRRGRVFVDWSQNSFHKTTVCAYSLRATQRPWVSAPLDWSEVEAAHDSGDLDPLRIGPGEVLDRCSRLGDLYSGWLDWVQDLPELR